MSDTSNNFGELLREHRRAAGLTQEELAERAGLSPRSISELERGMAFGPGCAGAVTRRAITRGPQRQHSYARFFRGS